MEKPSAENAIIKFTGDIMIIDEKTYNRMPKKLQYMFNKLPNPGSDEVLAEFAKAGEKASSPRINNNIGRGKGSTYYQEKLHGQEHRDTGTAARFFYCAKASRKERNAGLEGMPLQPAGSLEGGNDKRNGKDKPQLTMAANHHPTVKPLALMR